MQKVPSPYAVAWGWNSEGRSGNVTASELWQPKQVQKSSLKGECFIACAAGKNHSLMVCDEGKVYAFGEGRKGQLGLGNQFTGPPLKGGILHAFPRVVTPSGAYKHKSDLKISQVAAGGSFSVAKELSMDEGVDNVTGFKELELSMRYLMEMYPESYAVQICWAQVRQEKFAIKSQAEGQVIVWGTGDEGQLGLGKDCKRSLYPQHVKYLRDVCITRIAAGEKHVLAIDKHGRLFSWGCGKDGRLGHGDFENRYFPEIVHFFNSLYVEYCAAGDAHSAVLSTSRVSMIPRNQQLKRVSTFGRGAHGRLGNGTNRNMCTPVLVSRWPPSLQGAQFHQIACGGAHTIVLASITATATSVKNDNNSSNHVVRNPYRRQSTVLCWGYGVNGQLGTGYCRDSFIPVKSRIDSYKSDVVCEVSAGRSWSMARTITGSLYTWGKGLRGQLGQGENEDSFCLAPRKLVGCPSFLRISSGYAHNLCIAASKKLLNSNIAEAAAKSAGDLFNPFDYHNYNSLIPLTLKKSESTSIYTFDCCRRTYRDRYATSLQSTQSGLQQNSEQTTIHQQPTIAKRRYRCLDCAVSSICIYCARLCHHRHRIIDMVSTLTDPDIYTFAPKSKKSSTTNDTTDETGQTSLNIISASTLTTHIEKLSFDNITPAMSHTCSSIYLSYSHVLRPPRGGWCWYWKQNGILSSITDNNNTNNDRIREVKWIDDNINSTVNNLMCNGLLKEEGLNDLQQLVKTKRSTLKPRVPLLLERRPRLSIMDHSNYYAMLSELYEYRKEYQIKHHELQQLQHAEYQQTQFLIQQQLQNQQLQSKILEAITEEPLEKDIGKTSAAVAPSGKQTLQQTVKFKPTGSNNSRNSSKKAISSSSVKVDKTSAKSAEPTPSTKNSRLPAAEILLPVSPVIPMWQSILRVPPLRNSKQNRNSMISLHVLQSVRRWYPTSLSLMSDMKLDNDEDDERVTFKRLFEINRELFGQRSALLQQLTASLDGTSMSNISTEAASKKKRRRKRKPNGASVGPIAKHKQKSKNKVNRPPSVTVNDSSHQNFKSAPHLKRERGHILKSDSNSNSRRGSIKEANAMMLKLMPPRKRILSCQCSLYNKQCHVLPDMPEHPDEDDRLICINSENDVDTSNQTAAVVAGIAMASKELLWKEIREAKKELFIRMSSQNQHKQDNDNIATATSNSFIARNELDHNHYLRRSIGGKEIAARRIQRAVRDYTIRRTIRAAELKHTVVRRAVCTEYYQHEILKVVFGKVWEEYARYREERERLGMATEEQLVKKYLYYNRLQEAIIGMEAIAYGTRRLVGQMSPFVPRIKRWAYSTLTKSVNNTHVDKIPINTTQVTVKHKASNKIKSGNTFDKSSTNIKSDSMKTSKASLISSNNNGLNYSKRAGEAKINNRNNNKIADESKTNKNSNNSVANVNTLEWRPTNAFTWSSVRAQQLRMHPTRRIPTKTLAKCTQFVPRGVYSTYKEGKSSDIDLQVFTRRYLRDLSSETWRRETVKAASLKKMERVRAAEVALERLKIRQNVTKTLIEQAEAITLTNRQQTSSNAVLPRTAPAPPSGPPPRSAVVLAAQLAKVEKQKRLATSIENNFRLEDADFSALHQKRFRAFWNKRRCTISDPCSCYHRLVTMRATVQRTARAMRRNSLPEDLTTLYMPSKPVPVETIAQLESSLSLFKLRYDLLTSVNECVEAAIDGRPQQQNITQYPYVTPILKNNSTFTSDDKYYAIQTRLVLQNSFLNPRLPHDVLILLRDRFRRRSIAAPERQARLLNTMVDMRVQFSHFVETTQQYFAVRRRRRSYDFGELLDKEQGIEAMLGYSYEEPTSLVLTSALTKDVGLMEARMVSANYMSRSDANTHAQKILEAHEQFLLEKKLLGNIRSDISSSVFGVLVDRTIAVSAVAASGAISKMVLLQQQQEQQAKAEAQAALIAAGARSLVYNEENISNDIVIDVWQEHYTEDGKTYYYNVIKGESRWELPYSTYAGYEVQIETQNQDENGNWYWFNGTTGESYWM